MAVTINGIQYLVSRPVFEWPPLRRTEPMSLVGYPEYPGAQVHDAFGGNLVMTYKGEAPGVQHVAILKTREQLLAGWS